VLDNKAAAVSSLYALAAVREAGIPLKRRVRIILGCDEETGASCMERYKLTEAAPDLAFTPDAEYPLVCAERHILQVRYEKKYRSSLRINCGTAANVIPGTAAAVLPGPALPCPLPPGLTGRFEGNTLTVLGRGGHASLPELAQNALQGLLQALTGQNLPPEDAVLMRSLAVLFGMDQHGERMNIDFTDDSGRITLVPTVLKVDGEGVALELDCRCPLTITGESLLKHWDSFFEVMGFSRARARELRGYRVPEESELVTTLMRVYTKHMGKASRPLAIGGGTYARAFPNMVAFGPVPEDEPSQCHMPNESMSLAEIRTNTVLLAEAICALAGENEE